MNIFNKIFAQSEENAKIEATKAQNLSTAKKAADVFKDTPFSENYRAIFTASKVLGYTANLVSLLTAFIAVATLLNPILGFTAYVLAFLICLMLEFIKNKLFKAFITERLKYKTASIMTLVVLFLISLISLGLSGFGAYSLPLSIEETPLTYTALDSVTINEIAALDKTINENKSLIEVNNGVKYKGTITYNSQKQNGVLLSSVQKYEEMKAIKQASLDSINQAKADYSEAAKTEAVQAHENKKLALVGLAVLFELLYYACLVFGFYYLYRSLIEAKSGEIPTAQIVAFEDKAKIDAHTKKIGFELSTIHKQEEDFNKDRFRNNYNANKSKAAKYKEKGDLARFELYSNAASYYKAVLEKHGVKVK
jgi:hypothetical protein